MKNLLLALSVILIACGGSVPDKKDAESQDQQDNGKTSCLAKITDPGEWYSLSSVSALVNQPEENIDQRISEQYSSCQYGWKSERKYIMKVAGREMELPTNNSVAITIKNLDKAIEKAERMFKGKKTFTYSQYFDSFHGQITKEDEKIIDEQIDKKGEEDENFDAKTAKKILDMAPTEQYEDLSGLGDDANKYVQLAPGLRETRLAVLHGNVVIQISVDISDEDEDDFAAAKSVAESIIGLCD